MGRLAPEKNLGLAFRAYRAMRRENNSVKFVVVGDGPQRMTLQENMPMSSSAACRLERSWRGITPLPTYSLFAE